jgi:hypothetical protein
MNETTGWPTSESIEIDHPGISNDHVHRYRWTFPRTKKRLGTKPAEVQAEVGT